MFSLKNFGNLALLVGALLVSVHTAAVAFMFCSAGSQCLASVYFGIPENNTIPMVNNIKDLNLTTAQINTTNSSVNFSDLHTVVQVVGLYLLLIGVLVLIVLEFKELKLLKRKFAIK